jgi:anti-sigma factor RsiW
MITMHEEWTEKLSDYVDGELSGADRRQVEAHLAGCAHCAGILDDLQRIVARARSIDARPPRADLWPAIAGRIGAASHGSAGPLRFPYAATAVQLASRRVSLSLPQLAAAAVLLIAVSGGIVWSIAAKPGRAGETRRADLQVGGGDTRSMDLQVRGGDTGTAGLQVPEDDIHTAVVSFADQQYDAAVVDLERALHRGRGRLDSSTIAIVEHNLQIIDQAIAQARQALAADPANSYLSTHLVEARRRKLDLLRRAAALTGEAN